MTQPPRLRREVVSFARRDGRGHRGIARAWSARHEELLVHPVRGHWDTSLDPAWRFDPLTAFGRSAPLVVEIGSGAGEVVLASAAAHPERDHLAVEVYRPGATTTVLRADRRGLTNVLVLQADAAALLRAGLAPDSVAECWVFFPDPWPKGRHRKRRLVNEVMVADVARALVPGGALRLSTDWEDYATQMLAATSGCPQLANPYTHTASGGFAPRWEGRVPTRFERKGRAAGRRVVDLELRRRDPAPKHIEEIREFACASEEDAHETVRSARPGMP